MIEDFRLKVFEAVAEFGSFTAAARELGVSQPAVSQNITELEKKLGVQLVSRSRAAVNLTDDGRKFRIYAHQILHWYDAANAAFGSGADPDTVIEPSPVSLGDGKQALLWSYDGDIHITFNKD